MNGIFHPPANGGVSPSSSVCSSYAPSNSVNGDGPYYIPPLCATKVTDCQFNAITSEILAAVDLLGNTFDANRIDNLGPAIQAQFDAIVPGPIGATGSVGPAGAQGLTGAQGWPGPGGLGPTGSNGQTGATGPRGATGTPGEGVGEAATGATGPNGATGATGSAGSGFDPALDAPMDDNIYARRDGQWILIGGEFATGSVLQTQRLAILAPYAGWENEWSFYFRQNPLHPFRPNSPMIPWSWLSSGMSFFNKDDLQFEYWGGVQHEPTWWVSWTEFYIRVDAFKGGGSGDWVDSSDERIKTIEGDYMHGLAQIEQLRPIIYSFKKDDARKFIGLSAQAVELVMPEMVTQKRGHIDDQQVDDLRILDTSALVYALVNSVKTLSQQFRQAAERLTAMEAA